MALLELREVHASYGSVRALHGVSCAVEAGTVVALLGANGAGKTTTLRSVSGTVKTQGEILYDGERINHTAPERVARMGVAHVPEGRGVLGQFTLWENLRMGAYMRRGGAEMRRDFDRVVGYFPWMADRRDQVAASLSGGEQQMLAIARALLSRPRLLLLDEPSLGLAPRVVREIFALLGVINKEEGMTMLLVEQNASLALQLSTFAYVLEAGRVAVSGMSEKLSRDEGLRKSYLGY
jgi:branched-chain amino acid transport system ATP-binding protein